MGLMPRTARGQLVDKPATELKNGEYNWKPERAKTGPISIIVSIPDQRVYVYRSSVRIATSTCSTGKPGHRTPTGVFKILQKDKHHRSSTYSNAPMPNMNRLTWSGVALHAGNLPGYPASHGCVRLPMGFSELLFGITYLGAVVIIADNASEPADVVHPGMVLGAHARHEFGLVHEALHEKHDRNHLPPPDVTKASSTSVLISSADRAITIFENHHIVASGKATIAEPGRPLGHHVFILVGPHAGEQGMHWTAVHHGRVAASASEASVLKRIGGDRAVIEAMKRHMHIGMTLVTTDEPSGTHTRTASDFTLMTNEVY
jgi:hypothetical protein